MDLFSSLLTICFQEGSSQHVVVDLWVSRGFSISNPAYSKQGTRVFRVGPNRQDRLRSIPRRFVVSYQVASSTFFTSFPSSDFRLQFSRHGSISTSDSSFLRSERGRFRQGRKCVSKDRLKPSFFGVLGLTMARVRPFRRLSTLVLTRLPVRLIMTSVRYMTWFHSVLRHSVHGATH